MGDEGLTIGAQGLLAKRSGRSYVILSAQLTTAQLTTAQSKACLRAALH